MKKFKVHNKVPQNPEVGSEKLNENSKKRKNPAVFSAHKIADKKVKCDKNTSKIQKKIGSTSKRILNYVSSEFSVDLTDENFVCSEETSDSDFIQNNVKSSDYFGNISETIREYVEEESPNASCSMDINEIINNHEDSYTLNSSENSSDYEDTDLKFELYEVESDHLIVLKYSESIKIHGYCHLNVLLGKLNIMGHMMTVESPGLPIFSPRGTALLTLENKSNYNSDFDKLTGIIGFPLPENLKNLRIRKDSCVLLLSKNPNFNFGIIENHMSQWILPNKSQQFPNCEVEPKGLFNKIEVPKTWDEIILKIRSNSKIFICGGKGVGKSTFLRYSTNKLLKKYEAVKIIDLDPGQSEFTVPGSISIVTVKKPLLGVNYTHLQETDRSILCDINVSGDPQKFIDCVMELVEYYDAHQCNVPTIINFMGYTNDIAFYLLSSTISVVRPNKIVNIQSNNDKKNYKIELNKSNLREYSKLFTNENRTCVEILEMTSILSVSDDALGWSLEPRQMREMCILSYFGANFKVNTLQDYRLPMFEFDLRETRICDKNNCEISHDAINANIVALCTLINERKGLFQCYGWGIVRAIDSTTKKAILITPINEITLEKITHLVAGCSSLPPSVYMNYENVTGKVPYVTSSELIDFAQFSKRSHLPPKNRK